MILGKDRSKGIYEMQRWFSHIPGTIEFSEMEADVWDAQEELC